MQILVDVPSSVDSLTGFTFSKKEKKNFLSPRRERGSSERDKEDGEANKSLAKCDKASQGDSLDKRKQSGA